MSTRVETLTPQQYVETFFKRCGIGSSLRSDQFWRLLKKKFGDPADLFGNCVAARERGENVDPYNIKNQSVDFANAIAAQFDSGKIKAVAVWILQEGLHLEGKKVLEIGCDNGILLCLLAEVYRETRFIGVDPCEPAIQIARQRADELGLINIEFHVGSAGELSGIEGFASFDLILAVTVFHEILAGGLIGKADSIIADHQDYFSIEELDQNFATEILEAPSLAETQRLLSADGKFVSVDRWGGESALLKWIRLSEAVGMSWSLAESIILQFKLGSGDSEVLPLTVFSKNSGATAQACDILSFRSYPAFVQAKELHKIEDARLAELLYAAMDKQEFYFHELTYSNGSGVLRTHIGVAKGMGYIYSSASGGFRELLMIPSALMNEKIREVIDAREGAQRYAAVRYSWGDKSLLTRLCIDSDCIESRSTEG